MTTGGSSKRRGRGSAKTSRTGHRRYQEQRDRLRRKARRDSMPCCFCGQPIDYDLKYPHPASFSADHARPVTKGGANYGPAAELRPAHLRCNISAGNRHYTEEQEQEERVRPVRHYFTLQPREAESKDERRDL